MDADADAEIISRTGDGDGPVHPSGLWRTGSLAALAVHSTNQHCDSSFSWMRFPATSLLGSAADQGTRRLIMRVAR